MPAVAQLLGRSGLRSRDLEAVAVALGPGGFSALRTGLSVAKGLAMASGIPIVGVGSLDLEAHPFREAGLPVCALLEAGRGEAASALIGADGVRFREDRITGPDELLDEIEVIVPEAPLLLCGEGLPAWSDSLRQRMGSSAVVCYAPPSGRAVALADLASQRLERGMQTSWTRYSPTTYACPALERPNGETAVCRHRLAALRKRREGVIDLCAGRPSFTAIPPSGRSLCRLMPCCYWDAEGLGRPWRDCWGATGP